jgi:hypothetical protein
MAKPTAYQSKRDAQPTGSRYNCAGHGPVPLLNASAGPAVLTLYMELPVTTAAVRCNPMILCKFAVARSIEDPAKNVKIAAIRKPAGTYRVPVIVAGCHN